MSLVKAKRKIYHGLLPSAPSNPNVGDMYVNSTLNQLLVYYGVSGWGIMLTITPPTQENIVFDGENVIFDGEQVKG